MTARGKPGKPKAGFPLFPPSLESPQKQRASHIPTAPTTSPYLTKTKHGRPYGRAENRQLGGWAKTNCRSGPKSLAKAKRSSALCGARNGRPGRRDLRPRGGPAAHGVAERT